MKKLGVMLLVMVLLSGIAFAQKKDRPKAQHLVLGQMVVEGFTEATFDKLQSRLSGPKVHIFSKDGKLDAEAADVVLRSEAVEGTNGKSVLKDVVLTGTVKLVWKQDPSAAPSQYTKTQSDSATIDWLKHKAVLKDNVLIETTDPMMFGQMATVSNQNPVSITTDEATVSFLPELEQIASGEPRIRITGNPTRNKIKFFPSRPQKKESEPTSSANQD